MDSTPNMLDFVKAMSDADRLRIIGVLTQHSATLKQAASDLHITFREAFNHLSYSDERKVFVPAPELDEAHLLARESDGSRYWRPS
jgi:hypothetical protein